MGSSADQDSERNSLLPALEVIIIITSSSSSSILFIIDTCGQQAFFVQAYNKTSRHVRKPRPERLSLPPQTPICEQRPHSEVNTFRITGYTKILNFETETSSPVKSDRFSSYLQRMEVKRAKGPEIVHGFGIGLFGNR